MTSPCLETVFWRRGGQPLNSIAFPRPPPQNPHRIYTQEVTLARTMKESGFAHHPPICDLARCARGPAGAVLGQPLSCIWS